LGFHRSWSTQATMACQIAKRTEISIRLAMV
jgi:hypothetical protein